MRLGTKSVLFGAHAFWLHPWIVAIAWFRLYGVSTVHCKSSGITTNIFDPLLWLVFLIHDIGYIGKKNMDGEEGEKHPFVGANIVRSLLRCVGFPSAGMWYDFCLLHSRFLARELRREPSLFCWADKMAIAITPSFVYIPMTMLTGEIREYMHVNPREVKGRGKSILEWHRECRIYCRSLAIEHKDGKIDTWTPRREPAK